MTFYKHFTFKEVKQKFFGGKKFFLTLYAFKPQIGIRAHFYFLQNFHLWVCMTYHFHVTHSKIVQKVPLGSTNIVENNNLTFLIFMIAIHHFYRYFYYLNFATTEILLQEFKNLLFVKNFVTLEIFSIFKRP